MLSCFFKPKKKPIQSPPIELVIMREQLEVERRREQNRLASRNGLPSYSSQMRIK